MMGGMSDRPTKNYLRRNAQSGFRGILVYCADYQCSHSVAISGDGWPDVRLSDIEARLVCQDPHPQKITFAEMRESGVHGLLVFCADCRCSHSIAVSGDRWPDDLRLSDI